MKTKKIHNGYRYILVGTRWMPEHRLVVEEFLNRYLDDKEVIHHINFNRLDNRIENLMLFKSQKEHASFHLFIKKYGMNKRVKRMIENRWDIYK